MSELTQNLGDKLRKAMGEDLPTPRRNPKSGFDRVETQSGVTLGDKNSEENGTASSQHNVNQNNSMENNMPETNETTTFGFPVPQNGAPAPVSTPAAAPESVPFNIAVGNSAITAAHALAHIATHGVKFQDRSNVGARLTGAAIGTVVAGGGAMLAASLIPEVPLPLGDVVKVGALAGAAGAIAGAAAGDYIANMPPRTKTAK